MTARTIRPLDANSTGRARSSLPSAGRIRALILAATLGLGLAACSGAPSQTIKVDDVLATRADVISNAAPGSLVVTILHVRPPARFAPDIPEGRRAVEIPARLLLEHPHEKLDRKTGARVAFESIDGGLKKIETYAPWLKPHGAGLPPAYAVLTSGETAFVSTAEIAIGWAGVGPRLWVRPCRHGLPGHVDLVVENDLLRAKAVDEDGLKADEPFGVEPGRACLERAWFAGVDSIYLRAQEGSMAVGDPGHEGLALVVVSAAK